MKFKPSINQTIRGRSVSPLDNKRYNITEQPLKLKVTARLSQFTNENVLPLVLTIKYIESIPDLVVNVNTGDKTFLTTFIDSTDLFAFKIEVQNPNASPAIICIQEPVSVVLIPKLAINIQGVPTSVNNYLLQSDKKDNDINIVFANGGTPVINDN